MKIIVALCFSVASAQSQGLRGRRLDGSCASTVATDTVTTALAGGTLYVSDGTDTDWTAIVDLGARRRGRRFRTLDKYPNILRML